MNKYEIYKVKDASESYYTKKDTIIDLPMRMAIIGASQRSGKSNLICNLLLRDECYNKDFEGSNIYIVSPSLKTDNKLKKLIEVKDIPDSNLFDDYDEYILEQLYKDLQEHYNESVNNNTKPENKIIIFDDMAYGGDLKKTQHGVISALACNGRHFLVSFIITSQKYSLLPTVLRENCNCCILFSCSNKQLDLITEDHCYINKKEFEKIFRDSTYEKHNFFCINYTNDKESLYQDTNFNPIKINNKK